MKRHANRRAFSLIELMVVILIIALVVAILLPALGGVRQSARDTATRNLLQNLSQAITQFELDNRRLPGYFAASALGGTENGNPSGSSKGLTGLDNAMFELAGGIDPKRTTAAPGWTQVGPFSDNNKNVYFNRDEVGKVKYFVPPPQYYKDLDGTDLPTKMADGTPGTAGSPPVQPTGNLAIRGLVDADGMPIIGWFSDPSSVGPITTIDDMAYTGPRANGNSRFYLHSNYAMLYSNRLGKKQIDQRGQSMIGMGGMTANAANTLGALLSSPTTPKDLTRPVNDILPTAPRGSFVLQAAGRNGIYFGKEERGAARASGGVLRYGFNFKNATDVPLTDENGRPTSDDMIKDFDDIILSGN